MPFNFKRLSSLTAILLAAPVLCLPAAIQASGNGGSATVCELPNCASPGTLASGSAGTSGTFSFVYTFADTDKYSINGNYSVNNVGEDAHSSFFATANYIGPNPASGHDVLNLDLLQNFTVANPNGPPPFHSSATLAESGTVGTLSAELFYDGTGVGLMGPFTGAAGTSKMVTAGPTTFSGLSGSPLMSDFRFTYDFPAGTAPIPEPADAGLFALGLCALAIPVIRRKRNRAQSNSAA